MKQVFSKREKELKFSFPNVRAPALREFLRRYCLKDPLYPDGIVSSIYFDTKDFRMLGEKLSSDYLKLKVRLRWYSDHKTGAPGDHYFLEIKRKIGSSREKLRERIETRPFDPVDNFLRTEQYAFVNQLLISRGVVLGQPIFPILQIDYRRARFIDIISNARLSVDSDIGVQRINRQMLPTARSAELKTSVFEHKSIRGEISDRLQQAIVVANSKKNAFSKYSECCRKVMGLNI